MPVIVIPVASTSGGPVIAGIQVRRPSGRDESWPKVGTDQDLASGSTRRYVKGRRRTITLTWSKLTDAELDVLNEATSTAFVTYQNDPDDTATVMSTGDGISSSAIAATDPVRHSATLTLAARDVS